MEYINQLQKRDLKSLEDTVLSLRQELDQVKQENEQFSRIIHKDNKLIPAMELTVEEILNQVICNPDEEQRIALTSGLLEELHNLSSERAGVLKSYEQSRQSLPRTGILILDALFSYMQKKAQEDHVEFHLEFDNSLKECIPALISERDAYTILADLIDNALIAIRFCGAQGHLLIQLDQRDSIFRFAISDNGLPFPDEVMQSRGRRRITTHADTGGSGIGLMTVFEICQQYRASFVIEQQFLPRPFTKCVSVVFDGKGSLIPQ